MGAEGAMTTKPKLRNRALWIVCYALICAIDFLLTKAKRSVEGKIIGESPRAPKADEGVVA